MNATDSLMARCDDSEASATARQREFQLPLLLGLLCNQPQNHEQVDMLNLLLG